MEQLVLLLIIGAISLINWLLQRSAELREKRKAERAAQAGELGSPPPPVTGPPPVLSEPDPSESMRKLMEALGLPVESPPPARVPPPIPTAHEELIPEPVLFVPEPEIPVVKVSRPAENPLPRFEKPVKTVPAVSESHTSASSGRFRAILATPGGVRDAIVLAEVLGKPLAVRTAPQGDSPRALPG
ncbi:MAG: hypothetical protein Fur0032_07640 [Terrimicrobiaceae bacterium]